MSSKHSVFFERIRRSEEDLPCEKILQEQWNRIPLDRTWKTTSGIEFKVLSRGVFNHGKGPDFQGARLDFSGTVKQGDVEIHRKTSDWIAHGHTKDPAYGNVILHAVESHDPTASDAPFLPETPVFLLSDVIRNEEPVRAEGLCCAFFRKMRDEDLTLFVTDAGCERLQQKSKILLQKMIDSGVETAFRDALFEQIGVPDNRMEFRQLSGRLSCYQPETLRQHFEAILWGESGLLPDPAGPESVTEDSLSVVKALWNEWWQLRLHAQGPLFFSRTCRPLNSPERRVALLALWFRVFSLNPFPLLMRIFAEEPDPVTRIRKMLNVPGDFWANHTSFRSAPLKNESTLIGRSRLLELMSDVLLPGMWAYASILKKPELQEQTKQVFLSLSSPGDNRTSRIMVEYVFPGKEKCFRSSAAIQGLIHMYKTFCTRHAFDCCTCEVYRSFQNEGDSDHA